MKFMNHFLKITISLFLVTCLNSFAAEPLIESTVRINDIEIVGTRINRDDDTKILAWYGLPYAQPPIGAVSYTHLRAHET